jgi:hypothetical protein
MTYRAAWAVGGCIEAVKIDVPDSASSARIGFAGPASRPPSRPTAFDSDTMWKVARRIAAYSSANSRCDGP